MGPSCFLSPHPGILFMIPAPIFLATVAVAASSLLPRAKAPGSAGERTFRHASRALPTRADVANARLGLRGEFGARVAIRSGGPSAALKLAVAAPSAVVDDVHRGRVDLFHVAQPSVPPGPAGTPRPTSRTSLSARNLSEGARFGDALAWSGDCLAIGAPNANSGGGARAGLVRVFRVGTSLGGPIPVLLEVEFAPDAGADGGAFGSSIAWSADGARLAVGAPFTRGLDGTLFAGAVHVFSRHGDDWRRDHVLAMAEPAVAAAFGHALAWVGETLVVGAPGEGSLAPGAGRVFGFVDGDQVWSLQPEPGPVGSAGARFGEALASDGARAFVVGMPGRGAVEVLDLDDTGGAPDHRALLCGDAGSAFGRSIAMGPAGNRMVVGAPSAPGRTGQQASGAVHVFERVRGAWRACGVLGSLYPSPLGEFGLSLGVASLTGGRGVVVVGEPGADLAGAGPGAAFDSGAEPSGAGAASIVVE